MSCTPGYMIAEIEPFHYCKLREGGVPSDHEGALVFKTILLARPLGTRALN